MARSAKITTVWGDGPHDFRLAIGELEELDEKTQSGPLALLTRLNDGTWHICDVRETLRIGLIGGGLPAAKAHALVKRYVDDVPDWLTNATIASAVIMAALSGFDDEPIEKKADGAGPSAPMDASTSPLSTQLPPSSD